MRRNAGDTWVQAMASAKEVPDLRGCKEGEAPRFCLGVKLPPGVSFFRKKVLGLMAGCAVSARLR
jgi:hypothetical protein